MEGHRLVSSSHPLIYGRMLWIDSLVVGVPIRAFPREPKHHQTWCFLCEKRQKNDISYDGTDKKHWCILISSMQRERFINITTWFWFFTKCMDDFDEIFPLHWWNQNTSLFLSVPSFKFHFFDISAPWVVFPRVIWSECRYQWGDLLRSAWAKCSLGLTNHNSNSLFEWERRDMYLIVKGRVLYFMTEIGSPFITPSILTVKWLRLI